MNLGVILPHTKLYGGVKRFLELGNVFIELGHRFTVYTVEGIAPDWFDFKGETKTFDKLKEDETDALFTTETKFIDELVNANAKRRILYHVRITENLRPFLKHKNIEIFACSTNIYLHDKKKYGIEAFKALGGVNTANYQPKTDYLVKDRPFVVMAYGRLVERVKGTKYVIRACEKLYKKGYNIRLLLFDTAVNEKAQSLIDNFATIVPFDFVQNHPFDKNSELFNRADLFVAAERHAGWSNTVCEAMSCALPVIATRAGTKDLLIDEETGLLTRRFTFLFRRKIKRMIEDEALRERLGRNARRHVEQFDWHNLARKILVHFNETTGA
ncbi:glycosyltransferase family 4 protein [Parabacteroides sp. AM08-6]|uniref:glycosyltransferase family 4 protein n=1 Tax=Parabacteroides sp. AM08-6 TaxID=2292053 RepID=UPI000F0099C6|nr:glycosyltransferase family 4 protein [Parabacteroides sp. AM08-6]RHJ84848.1 glycosyltransferase [Parabacteroides sp. AM08-6]